MKKAYSQMIILIFIIILIAILAGCSSKTKTQLNLIGKELEKLNHQVQVGNILLIQEVNKVNKFMKKESEKCDEWMIWAAAPNVFRAVRYCEKKKRLNQNDIDRNKNN